MAFGRERGIPFWEPALSWNLAVYFIRKAGKLAEGLALLREAIAGPLSRPFSDALDVLRGTRGRVIVTGIGKSGNIGQKIAATFASTGTPAMSLTGTTTSRRTPTMYFSSGIR